MSVADKLNAVMKAVTALSKDGKMQAQNYEYLSEEKVTTELHKAFAEAGLCIVPVTWDVLASEISENGWRFIRLLGTYRLIDRDEPNEEPAVYVQAIGEGQDKGDKASNKAMTGAYKYALRQACMISTGDDPDHVSSEETAQAAGKPKQAQQRSGNGDGDRPQISNPDAPISEAQNKCLHAMCSKHFASDPAVWDGFMKDTIGRVCSRKDLTKGEASKLIEALKAR